MTGQNIEKPLKNAQELEKQVQLLSADVQNLASHQDRISDRLASTISDPELEQELAKLESDLRRKQKTPMVRQDSSSELEPEETTRYKRAKTLFSNLNSQTDTHVIRATIRDTTWLLESVKKNNDYSRDQKKQLKQELRNWRTAFNNRLQALQPKSEVTKHSMSTPGTSSRKEAQRELKDRQRLKTVLKKEVVRAKLAGSSPDKISEKKLEVEHQREQIKNLDEQIKSAEKPSVFRNFIDKFGETFSSASRQVLSRQTVKVTDSKTPRTLATSIEFTYNAPHSSVNTLGASTRTVSPDSNALSQATHSPSLTNKQAFTMSQDKDLKNSNVVPSKISELTSTTPTPAHPKTATSPSTPPLKQEVKKTVGAGSSSVERISHEEDLKLKVNNILKSLKHINNEVFVEKPVGVASIFPDKTFINHDSLSAKKGRNSYRDGMQPYKQTLVGLASFVVPSDSNFAENIQKFYDTYSKSSFVKDKIEGSLIQQQAKDLELALNALNKFKLGQTTNPSSANTTSTPKPGDDAIIYSTNPFTSITPTSTTVTSSEKATATPTPTPEKPKTASTGSTSEENLRQKAFNLLTSLKRTYDNVFSDAETLTFPDYKLINIGNLRKEQQSAYSAFDKMKPYESDLSKLNSFNFTALGPDSIKNIQKFYNDYSNSLFVKHSIQGTEIQQQAKELESMLKSFPSLPLSTPSKPNSVVTSNELNSSIITPRPAIKIATSSPSSPAPTTTTPNPVASTTSEMKPTAHQPSSPLTPTEQKNPAISSKINSNSSSPKPELSSPNSDLVSAAIKLKQEVDSYIESLSTAENSSSEEEDDDWTKEDASKYLNHLKELTTVLKAISTDSFIGPTSTFTKKSLEILATLYNAGFDAETEEVDDNFINYKNALFQAIGRTNLEPYEAKKREPETTPTNITSHRDSSLTATTTPSLTTNPFLTSSTAPTITATSAAPKIVPGPTGSTPSIGSSTPTTTSTTRSTAQPSQPPASTSPILPSSKSVNSDPETKLNIVITQNPQISKLLEAAKKLDEECKGVRNISSAITASTNSLVKQAGDIVKLSSENGKESQSKLKDALSQLNLEWATLSYSLGTVGGGAISNKVINGFSDSLLDATNSFLTPSSDSTSTNSSGRNSQTLASAEASIIDSQPGLIRKSAQQQPTSATTRPAAQQQSSTTQPPNILSATTPPRPTGQQQQTATSQPTQSQPSARGATSSSNPRPTEPLQAPREQKQYDPSFRDIFSELAAKGNEFLSLLSDAREICKDVSQITNKVDYVKNIDTWGVDKTKLREQLDSIIPNYYFDPNDSNETKLRKAEVLLSNYDASSFKNKDAGRYIAHSARALLQLKEEARSNLSQSHISPTPTMTASTATSSRSSSEAKHPSQQPSSQPPHSWATQTSTSRSSATPTPRTPAPSEGESTSTNPTRSGGSSAYDRDSGRRTRSTSTSTRPTSRDSYSDDDFSIRRTRSSDSYASSRTSSDSPSTSSVGSTSTPTPTPMRSRRRTQPRQNYSPTNSSLGDAYMPQNPSQNSSNKDKGFHWKDAMLGGAVGGGVVALSDKLPSIVGSITPPSIPSPDLSGIGNQFKDFGDMLSNFFTGHTSAPNALLVGVAILAIAALIYLACKKDKANDEAPENLNNRALSLGS